MSDMNIMAGPGVAVREFQLTTGEADYGLHKPDDLLQLFRNTYNPRIAVTVDMIAIGTDVKPLECLIFMRNIRSWSYFCLLYTSPSPRDQRGARMPSSA